VEPDIEPRSILMNSNVPVAIILHHARKAYIKVCVCVWHVCVWTFGRPILRCVCARVCVARGISVRVILAEGLIQDLRPHTLEVEGLIKYWLKAACLCVREKERKRERERVRVSVSVSVSVCERVCVALGICMRVIYITRTRTR
jgi:hypothetical protein